MEMIEEARRQEMIEKAKEEAAAAEAEAAAAEGEGGEGEAAAEAPAAEEAAEDKPAEEEAVKEEEGAAETTEPAAEPAAASSSSVAVEGGFGQAVKLDVADIKLGRSIASGAEAEVFRGLLWGQKAAVKQLKLVSDDGAEKEASVLTSELEHETRILSKLNHPCVLTLIGYTDEPCQIVLEVLDGTIYDLTSMLYSGTAPEGVSALEGGLLGPLSDVLSACAYLHALTIPILHRDLKPPNVLHDERFRCKLCDFGTAIELRQGADLPTEWIGSQLYVAPEIDKGEPYGLLADVFSFGAMAYELYHMLSTGVNFYGEGDMFEGGGMFEGLEVLRAPLTADPPEQPARPDACDNDAMWELLMSTVAADAAARPSFAKVAREVGEIRQAAGSLAEWL
jgi:serine/threonine protein kinase